LVVGWYKNQTIHYFDFGANPFSFIPIFVFPNVRDSKKRFF
jgi:hypothetical protein